MSRNYAFDCGQLSQLNKEKFQDRRIRSVVVVEYHDKFPDEKFKVLVEFNRKYTQQYARKLTGIIDGCCTAIEPHQSYYSYWLVHNSGKSYEVFGSLRPRKQSYMEGKGLHRTTSYRHYKKEHA